MHIIETIKKIVIESNGKMVKQASNPHLFYNRVDDTHDSCWNVWLVTVPTICFSIIATAAVTKWQPMNITFTDGILKINSDEIDLNLCTNESYFFQKSTVYDFGDITQQDLKELHFLLNQTIASLP